MPSTKLVSYSFIAAFTVSLAAAPAFAQDQPVTTNSGTTFYGTLGYTGHEIGGTDLGTVQGRLGARFGKYFGVEGEFGGGVNHQAIAPGDTVGINDQETLYGVGYLPLGHHIDLVGRIGFGRTGWDYKGLNHPGDTDHNWNYGGGAQWFFRPKDGIRAEYTRENFDHAPDGDDWTVSYVRRF